jgi:hypothetical protein
MVVLTFRRDKRPAQPAAREKTLAISFPPVLQRIDGGGVAQPVAGSLSATARSAAHPRPLASYPPLFFPFSLPPAPLHPHTRAQMYLWRSEEEDGAAVSPLADVRARPRMSAPSSSGLAAAPVARACDATERRGGSPRPLPRGARPRRHRRW